MGSIPRDYNEQCRFDAFCKAVLRNEARNLQQSMKRQRRRTKALTGLRTNLAALMPKGG